MDKELHPFLQAKADTLFRLCEKFGVTRLFVFGSIADGSFSKETSDVDLIAEIPEVDPIKRGRRILDFYLELEELFEIPVDLITNYDQLSNPFLVKGIEASKQLIYEQQAEEIPS